MRASLALSLVLTSSLFAASLHAQKAPRDNRSGYDKSARATVAHDTIVYVDPDDTSTKVAEVTLGHEIVVIQHNGPWVKVFANTDAKEDVNPDDEPEFKEDAEATPSSGWIKDKGILTPQTQEGDRILFGLGAALEAEAEEPHPPKNAADGAHLLYRRLYQYFPQSPLAGEAAWRSADIRWQLDKLDNSSLPSAKEQEAFLRPQIYEGEMRHILKFYPGTQWAALAAWDLIDNKLCGDWQGLPRCPEMERNLYLRYAQQYPESPRAAQAMYEAIYRVGVLVSMYAVDNDTRRVEDAARQTQALAAAMQDRFRQNEWSARAASVAYRVQQGIPIYGSDRD